MALPHVPLHVGERPREIAHPAPDKEKFTALDALLRDAPAGDAAPMSILELIPEEGPAKKSEPAPEGGGKVKKAKPAESAPAAKKEKVPTSGDDGSNWRRGQPKALLAVMEKW